MTEDDLVAAILAEPDSDAPRLVYADWLQSRGDPLGEYIATAMRYERLAVDDPERPAYHARFAELGFERLWFERFRQYVSTERGMVRELQLEVKQLVPGLVANLRGTLIRELSIGDGSLDAGALAVVRAALPHMRLRRLRMSAYAAPERIVELLAGAPDLEELYLGPTVMADAGARLVAHARLPRLARLTIVGYAAPGRFATPGDYAIGDAGAEAIAGSPDRAALRELTIANAAVGPAGAAALVDGRLALAALDLANNPLGPAGVLAIARGAAPLEALGLGGVGFDDAAVAALATTPALARLRRLALAADRFDSGLTPAQLAVLVASPHLARDLTLELDGVVLGLEAVISYDGMSGGPAYSSWQGDVPAELAARFRVKVVGYPAL